MFVLLPRAGCEAMYIYVAWLLRGRCALHLEDLFLWRCCVFWSRSAIYSTLFVLCCLVPVWQQPTLHNRTRGVGVLLCVFLPRLVYRPDVDVARLPLSWRFT